MKAFFKVSLVTVFSCSIFQSLTGNPYTIRLFVKKDDPAKKVALVGVAHEDHERLALEPAFWQTINQIIDRNDTATLTAIGQTALLLEAACGDFPPNAAFIQRSHPFEFSLLAHQLTPQQQQLIRITQADRRNASIACGYAPLLDNILHNKTADIAGVLRPQINFDQTRECSQQVIQSFIQTLNAEQIPHGRPDIQEIIHGICQEAQRSHNEQFLISQKRSFIDRIVQEGRCSQPQQALLRDFYEYVVNTVAEAGFIQQILENQRHNNKTILVCGSYHTRAFLITTTLNLLGYKEDCTYWGAIDKTGPRPTSYLSIQQIAHFLNDFMGCCKCGKRSRNRCPRCRTRMCADCEAREGHTHGANCRHEQLWTEVPQETPCPV
jgi:hypothetical protein